MATSTEVAIATTTLGTAASSIAFTSISSAYTDLRIVLVGTGSTSSVSVDLRFNSDSGANYSRTYINGSGSVAVSGRNTSTNQIGLTIDGLQTSLPHLYTADIFSYAGSTYKTALVTGSEDSNGSGYVVDTVGLWRSTSAITRIDLLASNFAAGTTATLYGIL